MLLSRFWYGVLALLIGVALYVAYVGVGQYNRRAQVALSEGLASDSQVVRWALQIDARRRLDALLLGAVDKGVQESLVAADKDKIPLKAREDAKKALDGIMSKLPAEVRPTALFAVDRDGRVVAQVGYEPANAYEDFELGGYPAVYDALHGYLRDDTWVLGGRMFRVAARPVEYDVAKPPAGAIVGLKAVDDAFAKDLARRLTRGTLVFFAGGIKVAQAIDTNEVPDRYAAEIVADIGRVDADKAYKETGRSGLRMLANEEIGAMFGRLDGDAWELRGGYAVARPRVYVNGPMGFLSGADDKDKANVPWPIIGAIVAVGLLLGLALSFLEHTRPMKELGRQAAKLSKGELDLLQLPRFRGGYRPIAQSLNAGIQRIAEKGGGAIRKEADLESILGPAPAQPAMSAFAFPLAGEGAAPLPGPGSARAPFPAPSSARGVNVPAGGPQMPASSAGAPAPASSATALGGFGGMGPGPAPGPAPQGGPPRPPPPANKPPKPPPPRGPAGPSPAAPPQAAAANGDGGLAAHKAPISVTSVTAAPVPAAATTERSMGADTEEDRTQIGAPSQELLAKAAPSSNMMKAAEQAAAGGDEGAEWLAVYEEFLRTKKECGEPTDGLTFEKFRQTLRKNRDALIQRHGCKRVKFSVYVKEGRASLKATPVKE